MSDEARGKLQALGLFSIPFFGALASLTGLYSVLSTEPEASWQIGGFLTNFEGGFTRRGLLGTLLLQWARWVGPIDLLAFVFVLMVLCLAWTSFTVAWNSRRTRLLDACLVAFSPALYSMYLVWDPSGGWRQDMLSILFILLSVQVLKSNWKSAWAVQILMGAALLPCLVLTHEASFFFCLAPFMIVLALTLSQRFENRYVAGLTLMTSLPAIFALGASYSFSTANPDQIAAMCEAWRALNPSISCQPPPNALLLLSEGGGWITRTQTGLMDPKAAMGVAYGFIYLLCLAWFPLARIAAKNRAEDSGWTNEIAVSIIMAVVILSSIPLYFLGIDYGRWLCISATVGIVMCTEPRLISRMIVLLPARASAGKRNPALRAWISAPFYVALSLVIPLYMTRHCCSRAWELTPIWERFG